MALRPHLAMSLPLSPAGHLRAPGRPLDLQPL